ncbi:MAG: 50S ribosomal protein L25, partial [Clostridiales bacterium]|nr:50S ribosomal protein L25 [Clostridiales bacterium]
MGVLNCEVRSKNCTHAASKVRRKGKIPGVLYGEKINNMLFEISELELNREILKEGETGVKSININGTTHQAIIKEIQKDPVTHKIIHIDLENVHEDKLVQAEIPINFINEEKVSQKGCILQKEKSTVKVQGRVKDLPKYINVDLKNLKYGESYRLSNLEIASDITFMENINTVIATVTGANTNVP